MTRHYVSYSWVNIIQCSALVPASMPNTAAVRMTSDRSASLAVNTRQQTGDFEQYERRWNSPNRSRLVISWFYYFLITQIRANTCKSFFGYCYETRSYHGDPSLYRHFCTATYQTCVTPRCFAEFPVIDIWPCFMYLTRRCVLVSTVALANNGLSASSMFHVK